MASHFGLLTRERGKKSEDLGRELSPNCSGLNFANSFSESALFLETTTPSRPCPRPKLIGGTAWVSRVVAASIASGEKGFSSRTNPGEVGRVLSGFRLRLLPRPSEAALSLTERRERGGSGWGPRSRGGGGHGFAGNCEHGRLPSSWELEAVALLPGPGGEQMGPGSPLAPTPGPRPWFARLGSSPSPPHKPSFWLFSPALWHRPYFGGQSLPLLYSSPTPPKPSGYSEPRPMP